MTESTMRPQPRGRSCVRRRTPARSTGIWCTGALVVDGGRIVDVRTGDVGGPAAGRRASTPTIVSPGLVDLQVNGGFGLEVGRRRPGAARAGGAPAVDGRDDVPAHRRQQRRRGLSGRSAAALAAARGAPGARMPGLHLEGPLLSPARAGAHRAGAIAGADATLDAVLDDLLARGRRPRRDAGARAARARSRASPGCATPA